MNKQYRFYSFVANLYLSPLQCGLQTAHAVSEMANQVASQKGENLLDYRTFFDWADRDKTIIICAATNHAGVMDAFAFFDTFGLELSLPVALFCEDGESMNGMATACGIVVPARYWDVVYEEPEFTPGKARYVHAVKNIVGEVQQIVPYVEGSTEFEFIKKLKSYRLA
jgi:hypothetical protein